MTQTKTPDPACPVCAGTGVLPPFMDDCACVTTTAAVSIAGDVGAPTVGRTMTSIAGGTAVWTGSAWTAVETEKLTAAEYAAKYHPKPTTTDLATARDLLADLAAERAKAEAAAEDAEELARTGSTVRDSTESVTAWTDWADEETDDREAAASWAAKTAPAPGKVITPAQITLITRLVAERDATNGTVMAANAILTTPATAAAATASRIIDKLMAIPRVTAVPRPNKFAGTCQKCRGDVAAAAGQIVKVDGKWRTQHLDGGCLSAEAAAAADADRVDTPGLYTFKADGTTLIYRVRKARTSSRLYAERIVVDPELKEVSFAYDGHGIHRLSKHSRLTWAEAREFGAAYGSCIACGRTLSDARSLVAGYGSTCAKHFGWPTVSAKAAERIIAGASTWEIETAL